MVLRTIHQTISLDLSLRRSRSTWVCIGIVFLPITAGFVLSMLVAIVMFADRSGQLEVSWNTVATDSVIGLVILAANVYPFRQSREASRRLKRLQEDPSANVKPLPAPFQASLFGPYH
jgi:hypothetical protein